MERRLTKLKVGSDGRVTVRWDQRAAEDRPWDEVNLVCCDAPAPELGDSLAGLVRHVLEVCELPDHYGERLTVTGVSVSYAHDILGACIQAQARLSGAASPLVLNTPHQPSAPYSEGGDEDTCMTGDCYAAIKRVCRAGLAYADGDRAQADIEHMLREMEAAPCAV